MIEQDEAYSIFGSFNATVRACRLANEHQQLVHFMLFGSHIFAAPGDDPNHLYRQWVTHETQTSKH